MDSGDSVPAVAGPVALVNVSISQKSGVVQVIFVDKGRPNIMIFKPSTIPDPAPKWTFDLCEIELTATHLVVYGKADKYIIKLGGVYQLCDDEDDAREHALKTVCF
jgi:hypothetical protein